MDFSSGDVKAAIMRPAANVGGGGAAAAAGTSALLRGWREFSRSGAPARFLCFQDGGWADVAGEAVGTLRRAFQDRRAMAEAACGGRAYLFDFLRMARIDAATGEEAALAWIDDRGDCFFPPPGCGGRKRGRYGGDAPAEDEAESSSGVDERCSGSRGAEEDAAAAKRRKPSGAWGSAPARLEENDRHYQVVSKLFHSYGMATRGAAITAVRKIPRGARTRAFQRQGQLLAAARGAGAGTTKFAWYGASAEDVATVVERGFARNNAPRLGARKHGDGLHLSPPQSPFASAMLAKPDGSGEAHIVLCRVLMGRPEVVEAGSSQSRPSSNDYDSAVDKLETPQWYVVWSNDMNTRVLPEYVVSFKCPNLQPTQGSSEATSKPKKPSPPVARDMFPTLLAEIEQLVPADKCDRLQQCYSSFKMGQIKKDQFIRFLRNFIGDQVLTTVAKKLRG
ncbi:putative inactive poly [ADP-ribose] polymerase SRO3 [Dichanthelium oligosanthes]|uniref:Putative inactive poly [ADP-ribose] polymerase SRO3 n=1 Tax=Dichanthelium oligosanthes TaxID=888268 RepID=A0A1E5UYU6_9POAL|nr:putative inactive poly [ADP-ribose] polymerase SRO3 [Dichanthelium oligosanthes]